MTIKHFLIKVLKMTYFKNKNVDYLKFEKEFIDTLNKHAPMKNTSFRGKQKRHINKGLCCAIMTSQD